MKTIKYVVDNRVFLLGLDGLYRQAMKKYECGELLVCARSVCKALDVLPANVPIEGYYHEDPLLTEYFLRMHALHVVNDDRIPEVNGLSEFSRLQAVTSSKLFGLPSESRKLLPRGDDPLTIALNLSVPNWNIQDLTESAHSIAVETDDYSLVGLSARVKDALVLCAARESVVLYAVDVLLGIEPKYEYEWSVDEGLATSAQRFIDTFNSLFDEHLPNAKASFAKYYWDASQNNELCGRCVRIGIDDSVMPERHYHWGIYRKGVVELAVQDFWSPRIWTTSEYRQQIAKIGGDNSLSTGLPDLANFEAEQKRKEESDPINVEKTVQQATRATIPVGKKPWWQFW